ncbi:uncharacterized protein sbspon isoform X1 [Hippocampus comes]|uniref:uncharacterized protein sbspon isoform X1 n=1 Tax=Hippocampus comes TaxID=109280 RepID=UPI00094EAC1B|nr:PREDICTED: somatomedin-B and thrombospondin type-1 domain-containing protein isoform X1 [Hippocampus comes]
MKVKGWGLTTLGNYRSRGEHPSAHIPPFLLRDFWGGPKTVVSVATVVVVGLGGEMMQGSGGGRQKNIPPSSFFSDAREVRRETRGDTWSCHDWKLSRYDNPLLSDRIEMEIVYFLLLLANLGERRLVSGGCLGQCCSGRDMSCASTDWRMDRVYGTCYCDRGCATTLDCCFDYFSHCPAQACSVTAWSFWSGCAEPCQPSWRRRVRHIAERPANGDEPCPTLEERAGCMDYRDRRGTLCRLDAGEAKLCLNDSESTAMIEVFVIRACIYYQSGVWQGEAQDGQLWDPFGCRILRRILPGIPLPSLCSRESAAHAVDALLHRRFHGLRGVPAARYAQPHWWLPRRRPGNEQGCCTAVAGGGQPPLQWHLEEDPQNATVQLSTAAQLRLHLNDSFKNNMAITKWPPRTQHICQKAHSL